MLRLIARTTTRRCLYRNVATAKRNEWYGMNRNGEVKSMPNPWPEYMSTENHEQCYREPQHRLEHRMEPMRFFDDYLSRRIEKLEPHVHAFASYNEEDVRKAINQAVAKNNAFNGTMVAFTNMVPSYLLSQATAAGGILMGVNKSCPNSQSCAEEDDYCTRNPHKPIHRVLGVSAGSAAAVAAGMCDVALTNDDLGSRTMAASACGIVGFFPDVKNLTHNQSRFGIFARSTRALANSMDVISPQLSDKQWYARSKSRLPPRTIKFMRTGTADRPELERFNYLLKELERCGYNVTVAPRIPDSLAMLRFDAIHKPELRKVATALFAQWFTSIDADLFISPARNDYLEPYQWVDHPFACLPIGKSFKGRYQNMNDCADTGMPVGVYLIGRHLGPDQAHIATSRLLSACRLIEEVLRGDGPVNRPSWSCLDF